MYDEAEPGLKSMQNPTYAETVQSSNRIMAENDTSEIYEEIKQRPESLIENPAYVSSDEVLLEVDNALYVDQSEALQT